MEENAKIFLIQVADMSLTGLCLPPANPHNTGGYHYVLNGKIIYQYSPLDISIASVESYIFNLKISNLRKFYKFNYKGVGEHYIIITLIENNIFKTLTVGQLTKVNPELLKVNAPLYSLRSK